MPPPTSPAGNIESFGEGKSKTQKQLDDLKKEVAKVAKNADTLEKDKGALTQVQQSQRIGSLHTEAEQVRQNLQNHSTEWKKLYEGNNDLIAHLDTVVQDAEQKIDAILKEPKIEELKKKLDLLKQKVEKEATVNQADPEKTLAGLIKKSFDKRTISQDIIVAVEDRVKQENAEGQGGGFVKFVLQIRQFLYSLKSMFSFMLSAEDKAALEQEGKELHTQGLDVIGVGGLREAFRERAAERNLVIQNGYGDKEAFLRIRLKYMAQEEDIEGFVDTLLDEYVRELKDGKPKTPLGTTMSGILDGIGPKEMKKNHYSVLGKERNIVFGPQKKFTLKCEGDTLSVKKAGGDLQQYRLTTHLLKKDGTEAKNIPLKFDVADLYDEGDDKPRKVLSLSVEGVFSFVGVSLFSKKEAFSLSDKFLETALTQMADGNIRFVKTAVDRNITLGAPINFIYPKASLRISKI